MGKRLIVGLVKGLLVGLVVGAGVQAGLRWTTPGLLGYLLAAATGASAGLFCGKPPWRQEAWLEGVLKAVAGALVGAGAFWGLSYLSFGLGFDLLGAGANVPWNEQPLLFAPLIAGVFGSAVELDNTPSAPSGSTKESKRPPRSRARADDVDEILAQFDEPKANKKKSR